MHSLSDTLWELTNAIAKNSACRKKQVGAVIYNTNLGEIVGRGYNEHEDGICDCLDNKERKGTATHAEVVALSDMEGSYPREDLVMFINHAPCASCKSLIETLVKEVRYRSQH